MPRIVGDEQAIVRAVAKTRDQARSTGLVTCSRSRRPCRGQVTEPNPSMESSSTNTCVRDGHPGVLLLFRVGSVYEVLFEDAELVARELGLKSVIVRSRWKRSGGASVWVRPPRARQLPVALAGAGIPRRGCRGASEDDVGGIRERSIVRTSTPGTVADPALLAEDRATYLVAVVVDNDCYALAWTICGRVQGRRVRRRVRGRRAAAARPCGARRRRPTAVPQPLMGYGRSPVSAPAAATTKSQRAAFPDGALADLPLPRSLPGLVVRYLSETAGEASARRFDAPAAVARGDACGSTPSPASPRDRRDRRAVTGMGVCWTLSTAGHTDGSAHVAELVAAAVRDLRRSQSASQLSVSWSQRALLPAVRHCSRGLPTSSRPIELQPTPPRRRTCAPWPGGPVSSPKLGTGSRRGRHSCELSAESGPSWGIAAEAARACWPSPDRRVRPSKPSPALADALGQLEHGKRGRSVPRSTAPPARLKRVNVERSSTQGLFLEVPVNTPVPADWTRRGGLQKVERYTTSELEEHAVSLAEAEAVVASETKTLLAAAPRLAADCAGEARDLGRHLAAADALCSLATVALERGWICPTVQIGTELRIRAAGTRSSSKSRPSRATTRTLSGVVMAISSSS